MDRWTIEGTNTTATILADPAPKSFGALFLDQDEEGPRLAALNAGDSQGLYVGGGGINRGFGYALEQAAWYAGFHAQILPRAQSSSTGEAFRSSFGPSDPLCYCYVSVPDAEAGFAGNDGAVLVDVFRAGATPNGNSANAAMIYLCPPNGSNYDPETFLSRIEQAGARVITAMQRFHTAHAAAAGGAIPNLRACAYSSGAYRSPVVSVAQVISAIYGGIRAGLLENKESGITNVELPFHPFADLDCPERSVR